VYDARQEAVDAQWRNVPGILDDAAALNVYATGSWLPDEALPWIGANGPWRDPVVTA
jgi:glucose-6-phosphate 1-dehydrogenase